jgi:hypothetical protein
MTPPNGHPRSKAEWERLERSLVELDATIGAFAKKYGLSCSANYHGWPERSLVWGTEVRRLIQIYLEGEARLTFRVWLCASEDRGRKRYWKQENLREGLTAEQLKTELLDLLEIGYQKVNSWPRSSLEYATEVAALK